MNAPPEASPIVIGGTGGSGTRVVAGVLRDAGWFMGTRLNGKLDALPLAVFDHRWGPGYVADGEASAAMREAFEEALLAHLGEHDPSDGRWGWKHPHSYLLLPFLAERFEGLRFVHVVRDGRDMAISGNRVQLSLYGREVVGPEPATPELMAMRFWVWANKLAADHGEHLDERYLLLRLEDLCGDPVATVQRLLEFAGHVPDDSARLAAAIRTPATLGRWATLPANLLVRLEEAGGRALTRFGYSDRTAKPPVPPPPPGHSRIAFSSFGVAVELTLDDPGLESRVRGVLPPGWAPADGADAQARFRVTSDLEVIGADGQVVSATLPARLRCTPDGALRALDSAVRSQIGVLAPGHIFIHAGVVAHDGVAIVLPGRTHSGKTTLVSALVVAGAQYCSDEYAVLDAEGLVHPYPRPLSVRRWRGAAQKDVPVEAFGGVPADAAFPIGLIVRTRFVRGADFKPEHQSPAQGAMELLANALAARERPAEALGTTRRAAAGAVVLAGPRGEAEPTARHLLEQLSSKMG